MLRTCSAVQSSKTKAVVIGVSAALLLSVGMNLALATDTTIKTFKSAHHLGRRFLAKKIGTPRTFRLLTSNQFVQLPIADQIRYVDAFKTALVALDDEAKGKSSRNSASALLNLWLSEACADSNGADFCINVGVVRALGDNCKLEDGEDRHNFNTREDLTGLGLSVTCTADQKPCSPIFGFDDGGNTLCGSGNLTKSCAQQSSAQNTMKFIQVMSDCSQSPSTHFSQDPHFCGNLAHFFDTQSDLVAAHCQNSPSTKACGILKTQIKSISDVDGALDAIKGLDQANQASSNLNAPKSNCPPAHGPAPTPPTSAQTGNGPANPPSANADAATTPPPAVTTSPPAATTPPPAVTATAPDAATNGSTPPTEDQDPTHHHHHDQDGQGHHDHGGSDQAGANPPGPPPAEAIAPLTAPLATLTLTGSGSTTPQQAQVPAAPANAPAATAPPSQQQAIAAPPAQTSQAPQAPAQASHVAAGTAPAATTSGTITIPPTAAAPNSLPADCKKMAYAADQSKDFSDMLDSFQGLGPTGNQTEACDSLTLPNQSVVSIVVPKDGKEVLHIQPAPVNGKALAPVTMTDIDALMIAEASAILGDQKSDYKLSGDKLVAGYLPMRVIADAGAMPLQSDPAGTTAPHARGWMTADGTVIRYRPDQITDDAKSNLIGIIPNATAPGGGHQTVFNFPLGDDDQASNK